MICPFCKMDIEDDSNFCDQCGKELLICPKCNKLGKGKVCIHDGIELVSIRTKAKIGGDLSLKEDVYHTKEKETPKEYTKTSLNDTELILINKNLGLNLKIEGEEIIGRTTGKFSGILNNFHLISRQHCLIKYDLQNGWLVTDLGSTNGTKYNNVLLKQGHPQPLADRSFLTIANIEFYVEIRKKIEKTKRMD